VGCVRGGDAWGDVCLFYYAAPRLKCALCGPSQPLCSRPMTSSSPEAPSKRGPPAAPRRPPAPCSPQHSPPPPPFPGPRLLAPIAPAARRRARALLRLQLHTATHLIKLASPSLPAAVVMHRRTGGRPPPPPPPRVARVSARGRRAGRVRTWYVRRLRLPLQL
jgi:hypothetical protein